MLLFIAHSLGSLAFLFDLEKLIEKYNFLTPEGLTPEGHCGQAAVFQIGHNNIDVAVAITEVIFCVDSIPANSLSRYTWIQALMHSMHVETMGKSPINEGSQF